ncbi:hypothetical protein C8Q70DRAFT_27366 [Cubamyces menziesii]|nr:hypothetical protein C8Q70DRAFT_27366 [Cubamyces menziesii]
MHNWQDKILQFVPLCLLGSTVLTPLRQTSRRSCAATRRCPFDAKRYTYISQDCLSVEGIHARLMDVSSESMCGETGLEAWWLGCEVSVDDHSMSAQEMRRTPI